MVLEPSAINGASLSLPKFREHDGGGTGKALRPREYGGVLWDGPSSELMKFLVSIDIICFTVIFYCIIMFLFYYISIIHNNLFHYDIFTHLHNVFSSCALPTAPSCPPHSCWLPHFSQLVISHFSFFGWILLNFIRVSERALGEGLLSGVWAPYHWTKYVSSLQQPLAACRYPGNITVLWTPSGFLSVLALYGPKTQVRIFGTSILFKGIFLVLLGISLECCWSFVKYTDCFW